MDHQGQQQSIIMNFFKEGFAGGVVLFAAALLAIIIANSPLDHLYGLLLSVPVEVRIGDLDIDKPLLLWINDGLMAIFFFLVGLELKRELLEGELANRRNIILPGIGAVGGMLVPALIYVLLNRDNPVALEGWAIPAATDIAFALGVLMLLGDRVPPALKVFLTSLAIFDDVGAVIIIAVFYASKISLTALLVVACCLPVLLTMNLRGVAAKSPYLFVGIIMWVATLKSGVHATLAGVLLAMFVPMTTLRAPGYSPLKSLEHDLQPLVTFGVVPIFAFANAGISLAGMGMDDLLHSVSLGIALGLFVGKQVGIFGFCWLLVKLGLVPLPRGMTMTTLYGTSIICGIGFTMSLFIGSLAFQETGGTQVFDERLGIILGSLASGVFGYLVLRFSLPERAQP